jgi:hypothetical protein
VELRSDAAIGDFARIAFAEHCEVILMCESLDVRTRYALSHRFVFDINRQRWESWIGVSSVHHGERVHLRSESNELDDLISIALVLEVPDLAFMMIAV